MNPELTQKLISTIRFLGCKGSWVQIPPRRPLIPYNKRYLERASSAQSPLLLHSYLRCSPPWAHPRYWGNMGKKRKLQRQLLIPIIGSFSENFSPNIHRPIRAPTTFCAGPGTHNHAVMLFTDNEHRSSEECSALPSAKFAHKTDRGVRIFRTTEGIYGEETLRYRQME